MLLEHGQLLVDGVVLFTIALEPRSQLLDLLFLLLANSVEREALSAEPVALLLEFLGARFLLLGVALHICFFF